MRSLIRFLAAALAAASCATIAPAQQRIDQPGAVAHRAARTGFPERIGEFVRSDVVQYDEQGLDISAGYMLVWPEGRLALTVYIYPSANIAAATGLPASSPAERARLCGLEFEGVRQAITGRFQGARQIESRGAPPAEGIEPALTLHSRYRFEAEWDDGRQPLQSEAHFYCFVDDDWQVKYRVTGPASLDADAAIERFIRTGPWPGRQPAQPDETI